ncbi:hypothetical protein KIH77_08650 [Bifidobacterium sp. 82T24]|uniref:hypothetical protein n=1 Tax=Bifidobacterium pluvialisilvae TaxID=2834436 RepID=UPI001C5859A6|nr:hypothetical protein [Bifidobacterium pluvialisilvae]MBW3088791.1 hypothetical protein [Bifidobacterium pluvialisilvae]
MDQDLSDELSAAGHLLYRAVRWTAAGGSAACTAVGGVLAGPDIAATRPGWGFLGGGLVLLLVDYLIKRHDGKTNKATSDQFTRAAQAEELALTSLKQGLIEYAKSVYVTIGEKSHTRVTVYGYDKDHDRLIPLVRFSYNRALTAFKRSAYPVDKGFIAEVWEQGESFITFPTTKGRREKQYRGQGLTDEEIKALSMHPTSMLGVRLRYRDKNVGVVIAEDDSGLYEADKDFTLESNQDAMRKMNHAVAASIISRSYDKLEFLAKIHDCDPDNTQRTITA